MAKYRKKWAAIKAQQWLHGDPPLPGMIKIGWRSTTGSFYAIRGNEVFNGDWVLTDDEGNCSRCDPDTFAVMYERVDDVEAPGR